MPEVGCNNTIAMFFLQVFGHFDFLLQVLGQKADPGGSVWVRYLKPWNWDGKPAWKWENAASYLMAYQVPAAEVFRKMEMSSSMMMGELFLHLGLGEKVFSFLTPLVLFFFCFFHFLSKDIHSVSRFSHLELKCCLF